MRNVTLSIFKQKELTIHQYIEKLEKHSKINII